MQSDEQTAREDRGDEELILEEILKHEHIGKMFNIVCKCGYRGDKVSTRNEFQEHVAKSLTDAGFGLVPYE